MLVRRIISDGAGTVRQFNRGDLIVTDEIVPAANVNNAVTLTGAMMAAGILLATPTAAATYTADSAANIVTALAPYFGYNPSAASPSGTLIYQAIPDNTSFRFTLVNSAAFAITLTPTANTGVTVNRGTIAASSSKDILVTIRAGEPAISIIANSTTGSPILTGLTQAQAAAIGIGMIVTNVIAGLQGATVIGVNQTAGTVTLSANATATATGNTVNLSPVVIFDVL